MISLLPEPLLCHILSFLTTEQAVQTSVLSSRWRHIWRWVPRLELDSSDFTDDYACVDFVDKFLAFQGKSYLREFKLTIDNDVLNRTGFPYAPCLGRVLDVRKLDFFQVENKFGRDGRIVYIGLTLSVCEALVCLKLHYVGLPHEFVSLSLPCLKIMYLEDVMMPSDAATEALISCSPVLEVLKICLLQRHDFFVDALRVCSLSLKSFTLKGLVKPVYVRRRSVVIDAPKLEYLSLMDRYELKSFEIISVADSVKVDLDFEISNYYSPPERKALYNLLHNFSRVGDVTMSWRTLKFIHCLYHETDPLPKFCGLTRLRASMCLNASPELLPIILEACPYLKYLTLELFIDYQRRKLSGFPTVLPSCLVSSLEYVEMESPFTEVATELDLARYFMTNSTKLKKLVLRLNKSSTREKHNPGVLEQLIDSPRRSSLCQFEVIPVVPHPNAWPDGCLCEIE